MLDSSLACRNTLPFLVEFNFNVLYYPRLRNRVIQELLLLTTMNHLTGKSGSLAPGCLLPLGGEARKHFSSLAFLSIHKSANLAYILRCGTTILGLEHVSFVPSKGTEILLPSWKSTSHLSGNRGDYQPDVIGNYMASPRDNSHFKGIRENPLIST